jgi:hypothetical protein
MSGIASVHNPKSSLTKLHDPWEPYDYVRAAVGLTLLTAACLKAWQALFRPTSFALDTWLVSVRWIGIGLIEVELFVGLCLALNLWRRVTWGAAVLLFAAFAVVALAKIVAGESTCGCFGEIAISPW